MTVLVAYTPRPEGRSALARGITTAEAQGEDLLVVNASAGTTYVDPSLASEDDVAQVQALLEACSIPATFRQLIRGNDAAEEIIEAAEEIHPSVVVVGLRKRSAVGKLLLGSTAQRILLGVDCPVLAVKA